MIKILYVLLFLLIFIAFKIITDTIYEKRVINHIVVNIELKYKNRMKAEEERKRVEGNRIEKGFFKEIDKMIERSGILERFHFLNTELYIFITVITSILVYFISQLIIGFWAYSLIISILVLFFSFLFIYYLSGINFEKIDNGIIGLLNNIENFSIASKDIVTIFENTIPFLDNPLQRYIADFVNMSKSTGDIKEAFLLLEKKIENERLIDVFKNLEISSRHNANYTEIIKESRDTFKGYFKDKTDRKISISNGRSTIIGILGIGVIMLIAANNFTDGLLFYYLVNTNFGNILIGIGILIMFLALWSFLFLDRG